VVVMSASVEMQKIPLEAQMTEREEHQHAPPRPPRPHHEHHYVAVAATTGESELNKTRI
jgi:hypothetical protein